MIAKAEFYVGLIVSFLTLLIASMVELQQVPLPVPVTVMLLLLFAVLTGIHTTRFYYLVMSQSQKRR